MARCEEGYLCDVCGKEVENIWESGLYLRYVLGWIDAELLHTSAERHLRCDPVLAQFIVDPEFPPVYAEGNFDKRLLDQRFVAQREQWVTAGWRRLKELAHSNIPITDYPLASVRAQNEST
jgi:hypothetical protein